MIMEVKDLVKKYKNGVQALDGLTLNVREGEIFSLLGPNGAGKSTLIHILTTYLRPTSGSVMMFKKDVCHEAAAIRERIACVAQRISIDSHLSLKENMMFQSRMYKVSESDAKKRMETLIFCFGLEQYLKYPVSSYSGGVKRRLDIALNMMSDPRILFLDEPTVGMDIQSRRAMLDMMKKIRNDFGTTIFLTTHYLEEVDQISDTVCIMKSGREMVQGSLSSLRKYLHQDRIKISFTSEVDARKCFDILKHRASLKESDLCNDTIITHMENGPVDFYNASRWLLEKEIAFLGVEIMQPALEDVFISLTDDYEKEAV